jgi:type IV pilus assembly protein PilQ
MQSYSIRHFLFISLFYLLLFSHPVHSANANISLDLQNINMPDAIQMIAKFLNMNVIISPSVSGEATLHLREANPTQALDLLLTSHGLTRWRIGHIWFIGPRDEMIKRQQEEVKWQEIREESSTLITQVWQIRYAKADDLARLLKDEHASLLSKRGRVRVDTRTNVICIQDIPEHLTAAHKLIRYLDMPVKQIVIETRLVSVDNDFERELGINFTVMAQPANEDKRGMLFNAGHYSLAAVKLADGSLLDVKLAALENAGHAELISSPSLFTANQQSASIEAGEEVPYQQVSESGGTAVVFKKAVLGLKVTPQVLPGNTVLLQLQINQDRPSNKMVLGMPTISTRQIMTNVLVKSGQTIVLGGIYETNRENGQQRVPFISQVPVIGLLFRQQHTRENKRELLIFVTPKIIAQEA